MSHTFLTVSVVKNILLVTSLKRFCVPFSALRRALEYSIHFGLTQRNGRKHNLIQTR